VGITDSPIPSKLLIYGDICMDITVRAASLSAPGQDSRIENLSFHPGGSAANCAVAAARLGAPVEMIGVLGDDDWSKILYEDLKRNHVGVRCVKTAPGGPATTIAIIAPDGERTFYSYRKEVPLEDGSPLPEGALAEGDCLHLSGYSFQDEHSRKTALALIEQAAACAASVSLDPSFQFARDYAGAHRDLLARLDFIFPNREEACQMTGKSEPEEAADVLIAWGVKTVVVKLDRQGCYVHSAADRAFLPALSAGQVIDANGAGDAFCGGFLAGRLRGFSLRQAARLGNAAAAQVIAHHGGHTGAPTLSEMLAILKQNDDAELLNLLRGDV
jgi:sugar/nucleoside kinase (ribokinase family)